MGRETRAREQDVLLGPGANLIRVPHCGRNFEYFAEDPLVSARFATAVVEGIQSEDVIATVKHYAANNQETRRAEVSADVDERTLRELYLPAFRAAVEADVGAVMTAYNRVNGTYMSDHGLLVGEILKDEWGFDGFVMSDWFGTESTVGAANAGLDLEMPGVPGSELYAAEADGEDESETEDDDGDDSDDGFADLEAIDPDLAAGMPDATKGRLFGDTLGEAIDAGEVPAERLEDMVTRILEAMERIGRLEEARDDGEIDTPEHRALAKEIATRGTVLLENDGVLPLEDDTSLALIGPHVHEAKLGGGGSSEMQPFRSSSPQEGIQSRANGSVAVERGIPGVEEPSMLELLFGDDSDDESEPPSEPDVDEAVAAASEAEVAVVVVRDTATEAKDRESLALPGEQDELIEAIAEAAEETVVVLDSSGPVELPWREDVDAILETWYPGQADGEAIAAVLYGDSDPGGRLPVTFAPEETYPTADPERYPGVDDVARYDEGVFVGYRHFDAHEVDPTYPFGHGLSYAEFEYGEVTLEGGSDGDRGKSEDGTDTVVEVPLENVGDRSGHEVVQVYARPPESVTEEAETATFERPARELVGFASVTLEAGESQTVSIEIDERSLARYDETEGWVIDDGTYTLEVGRSSRDVRDETTLER